MVCWGSPYLFKFFKGCLPQILLGPFLNTLSQIVLNINFKQLPIRNCVDILGLGFQHSLALIVHTKVATYSNPCHGTWYNFKIEIFLAANTLNAEIAIT